MCPLIQLDVNKTLATFVIVIDPKIYSIGRGNNVADKIKPYYSQHSL